jgi:hypothetical protein
MILITAFASILDGDSDNIALPTNTLIGRWACIRENDLAATEWSRGALAHPKGANSNSERAIRTIHAAGSQCPSRVGVDSCYAVVAIEWKRVS